MSPLQYVLLLMFGLILTGIVFMIARTKEYKLYLDDEFNRFVIKISAEDKYFAQIYISVKGHKIKVQVDDKHYNLRLCYMDKNEYWDTISRMGQKVQCSTYDMRKNISSYYVIYYYARKAYLVFADDDKHNRIYAIMNEESDTIPHNYLNLIFENKLQTI